MRSLQRTAAVNGLFLIVLFLSLSFPIAEAADSKNFDVDQSLVKVLVKSGEYLSTELNIENTGSQSLEFAVYPSESVGSILTVSDTTFTLEPRQTFKNKLIFDTAGKDDGVYPGEIYVKGGSKTEKIPVIIEIESSTVLFDANLFITPAFKTVRAGEDLIFTVNLINFQGSAPTSVKIDYYLMDIKGNKIVTDLSNVGIETRSDFTKTFKIPEDLSGGRYVLAAEVEYFGSTGVSSDLLYIEDSFVSPINIAFINTCINNSFCMFSIFSIILLGAVLFMFMYVINKLLPERIRKKETAREEQKTEPEKLGVKLKNNMKFKVLSVSLFVAVIAALSFLFWRGVLPVPAEMFENIYIAGQLVLGKVRTASKFELARVLFLIIFILLVVYFNRRRLGIGSGKGLEKARKSRGFFAVLKRKRAIRRAAKRKRIKEIKLEKEKAAKAKKLEARREYKKQLNDRRLALEKERKKAVRARKRALKKKKSSRGLFSNLLKVRPKKK